MRRLMLMLMLIVLCAVLAEAETLPNAPEPQPQPRPSRFWTPTAKRLFAAQLITASADSAVTEWNATTPGFLESNPVARPFTRLGIGGEMVWSYGGVAATTWAAWRLTRRGHRRLGYAVQIAGAAGNVFGAAWSASHHDARRTK